MFEALRFSGMAAGYGGKSVVSGVDLVLHAGESVALVGPNGSGKTTCLRTITGEADVLAGSVSLAGKRRDGMKAREVARTVAVVPQTFSADFGFTGREFVAMGRNPWLGALEHPGCEDMAVVDRAMSRTDTVHLGDVRVSETSGGDLQRLVLAQALAQEPMVLVLDEPTSHLDVNHRLQILDLVRTLADEGLAVLSVLHDLDMAARYADRLAVLAEGTLITHGVPEEILTPELMSRIFGVRAVVRTDPATGARMVTPLLRESEVSARRGGAVLLVGGSGSAAWMMRRLVAEGLDVQLAGISVGDTDHEVAEVLGVSCVELGPFGTVDEKAITRVRSMAVQADAVIVCGTPFGPANIGNLAAVSDVAEKTLWVGRIDTSRDFTSGAAVEMFKESLSSGAVVVETDMSALEWVVEGSAAWR